MKRDDFLRHVGSPEEAHASADEMDHQALDLWRTVRHEYFTAAGKPRRAAPSLEAVQVEVEVKRLKGEAQRLRQLAHDRQRDIRNPWSHIDPLRLRHWGLVEIAERVEAAHQRYLAEAEAA